MVNGPINNWTGPTSPSYSVDGSRMWKGSPLTGATNSGYSASARQTAELLKNGKVNVGPRNPVPLQSGAQAGSSLARSSPLTPASQALQKIRPYGGTLATGGGAAGATGATSVGAASGATIAGTVAAGVGIGLTLGEGIRRAGLKAEEAGILPDTPFFEPYPPGFWQGIKPNEAGSIVPVTGYGPAPFKGGQSPGVFYTVTYRHIGKSFGNPSNFTTTAGFFGPTPSLTRRTHPNQSWSYGHIINGIFNSVRTWPNYFDEGVTTIESVVRNDGKPDTGGDPLGEPTASLQGVPGSVPAGSPSTTPIGGPGLSPGLSPGLPGLEPGLSPSIGNPTGQPQLDPRPFAEPTPAGSPGVLPWKMPQPGLANLPGNRPGLKPSTNKPPKVGTEPAGKSPGDIGQQQQSCSSGCNLSLSNQINNINKPVNVNNGGNVVINNQAPVDLTPVLNNQAIIMAEQTVQGALQKLMDKKLGDQLPNGGIGGKLVRMGQFLKIGRILEFMNTTLLIHNAFFLSQNIIQSVGAIIETSLNLFGFSLTDDEGVSINFFDSFVETLETGLEGLIGEEAVVETKALLSKLNRVYQAANNVIWSLGNLMDIGRELATQTLEHLNIFANANKKNGNVHENAWQGYWDEQVNAAQLGNARVNKIMNAMETLETGLSEVEGVAYSLVEVKETSQDLVTQRAELKAAKDLSITELTEKINEDKLDSESPVNLTDVRIGKREYQE